MIPLAHVALVAAATLAAPGRLAEAPPGGPSCRALDERVTLLHVFAALALPYLVQLLTAAPTALLSARCRARHLLPATAQLACVWLLLVGCARLHAAAPAVAYGVALHSAMAVLGAAPARGGLLGTAPEAALRLACRAALVAGAWLAGPPLPVLDTPAAPRGCGAAAHLAGLLLACAAIAPAAHALARV